MPSLDTTTTDQALRWRTLEIVRWRSKA